MEYFNPVSVLSSLYKTNCLFSGKVNILDTLIGSPDSESPFLWLYTNKQGFIKKKSKNDLKLANIFSVFLPEEVSRKEDIYGHYIYTDNYLPLAKKQMQIKVQSQILSATEAIQALPASPNNYTTRYIISHENSTQKYYKQYKVNNTTQEIKIYSHRHSIFMDETLKEVVKILEKNLSDSKNSRKLKIEKISLMFIEDSSQNLWLMGSIDCKGTFSNTNDSKRLLSTFLSSSSSRSLPSSTGLKFGFFKKKKKCEGDFCNFILNSRDLKNKTEIDYDNLVFFT